MTLKTTDDHAVHTGKSQDAKQLVDLHRVSSTSRGRLLARYVHAGALLRLRLLSLLPGEETKRAVVRD